MDPSGAVAYREKGMFAESVAEYQRLQRIVAEEIGVQFCGLPVLRDGLVRLGEPLVPPVHLAEDLPIEVCGPPSSLDSTQARNALPELLPAPLT
jgi:hypothetical protein